MHIPSPVGRKRTVMIRAPINRVPPHRILKNYTIDIVTSVDQHSVSRRLLAKTSVASIRPASNLDKSATRVDIALLVSPLFLQRFTLPFGTTFLHLDLVAIGLILLYQFLSGNLLVQYDRLLWFLALGFVATCSLLLNFESTMLTGYALFMVFYSLFTLSRPSTSDQYKGRFGHFNFS